MPKFDLILDAIGGKSLRRSYELLAPGGRLVAFGASGVVSGERRNPIAALGTALRMPRFNLIKQMSESKAVIGLNMYTLSQDERRRARWPRHCGSCSATARFSPSSRAPSLSRRPALRTT